MSHKVTNPTRSGSNLIDLKGLQFGHLRVIRRSEGSGLDYASYAFWQCLCDCGEYVDVSSRRLREGRATACGKTSCSCPPSAACPTPWAKPKPEQVIVKRPPAPAGPPRKITTEQRRAMVNGFLTSGFTRAEAEEMAGMGTVLNKEEVAA